MDVVDLDSSVPDWLIEHPELLPLFRKLGIDYCCGGKSLDTACRERGLDPQILLAFRGNDGCSTTNAITSAEAAKGSAVEAQHVKT
jgi:regulator of cell morphogenesis and NO signaling